MNIVIDARELRTSTGRYVERLLHYLQKIDGDHDYVVLLKPKDIDGWEPTNPRFTKLVCPYKEFTFGEQLGMLRLVQSLQADLVHFAKTEQPVLYRGRVVTTVHDLTTARFRNPTKNPIIFAIKQEVYKWVIKRVTKKSVRIITATEFVKDDLATYTRINPDKVTVTYEAADKITAEPEPVSNLEQASYILYVGRPQPHKNLERLVEAFVVAQKTHQDLRLVLAGKTDENYKRLEAWVSKRSIHNVIFTGFVSEGQLRWLYEHARAYVFPSLSEGFGLPGLEAMQYGLPVASSNATCLPEVYKSAVLYFDPEDTEDMAEKISAILNNPELARKLAQEGKELAKTYSWQTMAEQTLAAYDEALSQKSN